MMHEPKCTIHVRADCLHPRPVMRIGGLANRGTQNRLFGTLVPPVRCQRVVGSTSFLIQIVFSHCPASVPSGPSAIRQDLASRKIRLAYPTDLVHRCDFRVWGSMCAARTQMHYTCSSRLFASQTRDANWWPRQPGHAKPTFCDFGAARSMPKSRRTDDVSDPNRLYSTSSVRSKWCGGKRSEFSESKNKICVSHRSCTSLRLWGVGVKNANSPNNGLLRDRRTSLDVPRAPTSN